MKTVVIGIRKLIRCSWHAWFFFSSFVEWTAIVMVCLISLAVCLSLCTLLQNVQIAYSKVQNRPQPNDRFYCWLNVTARRQSNINHCTWWASRERWLASCHQFNSGSKIVLFMCLFPYWFDCWFGLNGFGLGLGLDGIWIVMPQINLNMNTNQLCAHWVSTDRRALVDMCRIKLMINIVTVNNGI